MKWINIKEQKPKEDQVCWVYREGRGESNLKGGYVNDDEIILLTYQGGREFRSLDHAGAYFIEGEIDMGDLKIVRAWLPYEAMPLPELPKS